MAESAKNIWVERATAVAGAKRGASFLDLVELSGLDKAADFRFADWSGVNFSGCDLNGFDFSGARLHGCNFNGAKISGARFDQAEIAAVLHDGKANPRDPARLEKFAPLRDAIDWASYHDPKKWQKLKRPLSVAHLSVGAVFQDAPFAPELVVIPPGKFLIGSPDGSGGEQGNKAEVGRTDAEGPRRLVTFEYPFAIGRFTVTFYELENLPDFDLHEGSAPVGNTMDSLRSRTSEPAVNVTWHQAVAYCNWLNKILDLPFGTYHLPSEAEWEYAARAGTDGPFWWEGPITLDKANYNAENEPIYTKPQLEKKTQKNTVPVQSFDPNPWGLYQVIGNVWEWCLDEYTNTLDGIPPDGSSIGGITQMIQHQFFTAGRENVQRVIRGGCWLIESPALLRLAYRSFCPSDQQNNVTGFRVARKLAI